MSKYKVTLTNIEWDVGKDPVKDGYDLEVIKNLPCNETCIVDANSEENALYFALDDITDYNGFCIQGYEKYEVLKISLDSNEKMKLDILKDFGVLNNPKADLCYALAYEYGHSGGYLKVVSCFKDFVQLIK
jgi:hypothetical protein